MACLESAAFALAISGRPVGAAQLHLDGALCRDDRVLEMTKVVEIRPASQCSRFSRIGRLKFSLASVKSALIAMALRTCRIVPRLRVSISDQTTVQRVQSQTKVEQGTPQTSGGRTDGLQPL